MATLSRDEARKERARKHAERGEECPCGRVVYGNGKAAHQRTCRDYLAVYGWPLSAADDAQVRQQLRDTHPDPDARLAAYREIRRDEARRRGLIT